MEPFCRVFYFNQFKNLHIVLVNFSRHCKRRHVNDIDVRVLAWEDACDLRVFFLFKLWNWHALQVASRIWVDMDFITLNLLDFRPTAFELRLHLSPDHHWLSVNLVDFNFSRFLKLVKAVLALNNCCFCHKELKLLECRVSFVSPPSRLDLNCCKNRSVGPFESELWIHRLLHNLRLVSNNFH